VTLADLKKPGTKLADVDPQFRGMPLKEWQRAKLHAMCEEIHAQTAARMAKTGETPWIEKQKIHTPRDGYGWRSI